MPLRVLNLHTSFQKIRDDPPHAHTRDLLDSEATGIAGFVGGAGLAAHSAEPN